MVFFFCWFVVSANWLTYVFFFRKKKTKQLRTICFLVDFSGCCFFCYPQNFTRKKNIYTSFWGVVLKRRENGKQKMPLLSETFGEKQTCPALMKTFLIHAVYNFHYVVVYNSTMLSIQCYIYISR